MKKDINLLPWRIQLQRQQNQALFRQLILCALICTSGWLILGSLAESHAETAETIQSELTKIQPEQQLTQRHIQQLRSTQTDSEELRSVSKETVFSLLNQLTELPLTQGELTELSLKTPQLTLTGYSHSQEEFSRLNQFLTQQPLFAEVKLTEFKPSANELQFQFDLTLQGTP
ncbi:PilN domain-containing protein [Aggregatibacter actinomycetemcomitans]|uniref:PilN domain-containing protein n=1 Tax=Aggregatibacter actinomycetemcomitans TaxID=714 RepID=UPI00023FFC76|nr:PilN domain-containing protein [Aggregatibacter actinomycetemcomitans]EHK90775.1 ComB [Aggregatibacter actinomycetemcomitans RhAA1]KNE77821.1 competence protein ComB [Aggregatibacter actinomycetemcomitans RhAA1]MBN6078701.1 PilN domain-containing protein [Aggregatibacter actinomycetemcomitans]